MRFPSGWAVILIVLVSGAVCAGHQIRLARPAASSPPPPPPAVETKPDPVVEMLIKDLGSEDFRTREKAGRELAARGEKALPALRAALAATEIPEIQRRLLVMVRKLDYDRLVTPKLVTLSLKDKTVQQAMDEIAKQTGYKINFNANGGPKLSEPKTAFVFDNVPFWQAVDKVASFNGYSVFNDYNDDDSLQVLNQDSTNPYVAYAGPFRFIANNINWNGNLQLAGINRRGDFQNRQEYINLGFQIQSEPKNPMLGLSHVDLISAVDEQGVSLVPPPNANNRVFYNYGGMFRGHNTYGNVSLCRANRSANIVKSLKLKVAINLLSGTVPELIITDPLKLKDKTFTGRTVEIAFGQFTEVANNKGHYQFELTAKKLGVSDNPQGRDYNWVNSVWQKIEVQDAAGNRYTTQNPNQFDNNGSGVAKMSIVFGPENGRAGQNAKLGPPVKVVVNEWQSVVHMVTIEFKDIPLP